MIENTKHKTLYIVGGVNGGGKSTFIKKFFTPQGINIIDVDSMAYQIGGDYSNSSNILASKKALEMLRDGPAAEQPLVWETVLSSSNCTRIINNFYRAGYQIDLTYIFLEDMATHLDRIEKRVSNGGHDIPKANVTKRFDNRKQNFEKIISYAHNWRMFCNQSPWFELVAFGHFGNKIIGSQSLFDGFCNQPPQQDKTYPDETLCGFFALRNQKNK